jgi:prephenate dehydratase/prephenate dehydrogenase
MHITIVGGSGHLGLWYARQLRAAGNRVTITGRNKAKLERAASSAGVDATEDNESAIRVADVVFVSTPIESTPALLELAARVAKSGALVGDLASVKAALIPVYRAIERQDIELVSLHPLHGPRVPSWQDVTVLAIPFRAGPLYEKIRGQLAAEGAQIVDVDGSMHDRYMAILQGLTHFVAIAVARTLTELRVPPFETPAYALLRAAMARVVLQDPALYAAIQVENPENADVRRAFLRTAERLGSMAEQGNLLGLEREIETGAFAFGDPAKELSDTDVCLTALASRRPRPETQRIATLGPPGTFSDAAVRQYGRAIGASLCPVYYGTIPDVFDAVKSGEAGLGMVPVENMIEGTIAVSLDWLFETGLSVCAELLVPVHHALSARAGARIESVRRVISIPVVLAQVRKWLRTHAPQAKLAEASSTADAIDQVARTRLEGDAAIGLASTAEAAGLEVLARDIEDDKGNVTRFFVIGARAASRTGFDRTSLCVHDVPNRPGVLDHILQLMARHGLNLSKVESRPTRRKLGEYQFYIDVEGHQDDAPIEGAIADLSSECKVTVLGSYPRVF